MQINTAWLEGLPVSESIDLYRTLAHSHAALGGHRGKLLTRLIHEDDLEAICELEHDWEAYREKGYTAEQVYHLVQAQAFFTKLKILDLGRDQEKAAWEGALAAEKRCRETNVLLRAIREGKACFANRKVEGWFYKATQLIAKVLGDVPDIATLGFRFGKGATTVTRKIEASIRQKLNTSDAACSEELAPYAGAILSELPSLAYAWSQVGYDDGDELWCYLTVNIMDGKVAFVLKNFKTHRVTVTEPPLNGLLQLAYGDEMMRLEKRFGIDLRDQTRNQNLARKGSVDGTLATIDSRSASDTNAKELVFDLLPHPWAHALARARTGHVNYKGTRILLEKFSSMGNGYTFPLESLIFWALACAVCDTTDPQRVSVYGDDVIVPSEKYEEVLECFDAAGFWPNEKKSFHKGPFRESCGTDWYEGTNIRPFFAKGLAHGLCLFKLHNFYVRRGLLEFAERVRSYIPMVLHSMVGPDDGGCGHLIVPNGDERTLLEGVGVVPYWFHILYANYKLLGLAKTPVEKTLKLRSEKAFSGCFFETYALATKVDAQPPGKGDMVLPLYVADKLARAPVYDVHGFFDHPIDEASDTRALCREIDADEGGSPRCGLNIHDKAAFYGAIKRGHGSVSLHTPFATYLRDDGYEVKTASLPSGGDLDTEEGLEGASVYKQLVYVL